MSGYVILRNEKVLKSFQNKPKWVICILCTAGLLITTLSAVAAGILIGYTYCYIEHTNVYKTGNRTFINETELNHVPLAESVQMNDKKTINEGLKFLVEKILKIGENFWVDGRLRLQGNKAEKSGREM